MTAWVQIRNLDFGAILAVPFGTQVDNLLSSAFALPNHLERTRLWAVE